MKRNVRNRIINAICGLSIVAIFVVFFYVLPKHWDLYETNESIKEKDSIYVSNQKVVDSLWRQEWKHRLDPEPDTGAPYKLPPIPDSLKFENSVLGLLELMK